MADVVQFRLERMAKDLDDLEQRGLFTRMEIAEIVKQRRKFEYRLKRPSPLKQDFLAYIDYETKLDTLRWLRKKQSDGKEKKKKSASDFSGVARIIELYRMAVTRFKGDVELWFKYLEFCRQRKNGRMKKALAQVVRFHPKVPGVWIYAAAWEFDHNANVASARALMQSGLRCCSKSEDLWVEYLKMELTYLNKLKARKVALGEDKGTLTKERIGADEKQWRDENQDLFMSLKNGSDDADEESGKRSDLFKEQGLNVMQVIYSGALEALPSSFSLRKRFFEMLDAVDLADSDRMREQILSDMKKDFSKDPEYWDWLARVEIPDLSDMKDLSDEGLQHKLLKAVKVYEEAVDVVPSTHLFNLYVKFLMDITSRKEGEMHIDGSSDNEKFVIQLLEVCAKAEEMGCLDEELASKYVSFYVQLDRLEEARELAAKLCGEKFSNSAQLWQLRVSFEVKCALNNQSALSKKDISFIFELLKEVLVDLSVSEAKGIWLMILDIFKDHKHYLDKLADIAFFSLAKNGSSEEGFSVCSTMVKSALDKDGIACAREMYKKFLGVPRPSLGFYKMIIGLELEHTSSRDKTSLAVLRKLFEAALSYYDQDLGLWQDYYALEMKMGTSETMDALCFRARKALKDASALTALIYR